MRICMKKLHIIVMLAALLFAISGISFAESKWGAVQLVEYPQGEKLTRVQGNLLYYEPLTEDASSTASRVYAAAIRNDNIIIWFGADMNKPAIIQVYTIAGEYLFGYRLQFDRGNGIFNMNAGEDWLQIYLGNKNCIYQFQSGDIEYFCVEPENAIYLYEYMGDDVEVEVKSIDLKYLYTFYEYSGKRPHKLGEPFLSYTREKVVLTTSDEKEIVLFQKNELD